MTVQEILRAKGNQVHTTHPRATLVEVARLLVEYHCGSLLVVESHGSSSPRVLGIITERDLLRAAATHQGNLAGLVVDQFMTTLLITGSPGDTIDEIMGVMTAKRVRHLPILDGDVLAGIVSIGDVVKAHHDDMVLENHYLKNYIQS